MKRISTLIMLLLAFVATPLQATTTTDTRRNIPKAFDHSYLGFSGGRLNIPYTNDYLENGFTAQEIDTPYFAPRIFIGHYFNPYFAGQASLMRPINWLQFKGVWHSDDRYSVWMSVFDFTLRPTIPLTNRLSLYADLGLALISRHGFDVHRVTVVKSSLITSFTSGGGLKFAINDHWNYELGLTHAASNASKNQPAITYVYTGFYYLLLPSNHQEKNNDKKYYIFPLNSLEAGFFNNDLFCSRANKYFTVGYLPIFWDGNVKNESGYYIMYERNFFHTDRTFSLEWGASASRYQTQELGQTYYTLSLFPEMKVWIIRGDSVDFYFTYSVAGPTYISRYMLDDINTGTHFIFQDFMGLGFFFGKKKQFNLNAKIGHYSNGNLFPMNAGIEVPLNLAFGFTFG